MSNLEWESICQKFARAVADGTGLSLSPEDTATITHRIGALATAVQEATDALSRGYDHLGTSLTIGRAAAPTPGHNEIVGPAVAMKPVAPAIPFMCIRAKADSGTSLCGRGIFQSEAAFNDAEHAVTNYENGPHLSVCADCVTAYRWGLEMAAQTRRGA